MTDEMLTTAPPSPSSIIGTAARVRAWAVVTLKWNASSRYRVDVFMNALGIVPPTLLTTTSRRPNDSRAVGASPATASMSERSAATTAAWRPACSTRAATSSSWDSVRDEITTSAPASAKATAVAAPMPRPAPVTTATLSVSRNLSRITAPPLSDGGAERLSVPVRRAVAESSGRGWSLRRRQRAATAGSHGVLADPGVHGDARGNARVDRSGGPEHGDRAQLRAGVAGGRRQAGALLAEEQHAPPGEPGSLERHRCRQVVDADDRQPGVGGPVQQVGDVGMVDDVLVEVGHHRPPPVPPPATHDVHAGREEGVGVAHDGADVEVVTPVLDCHVERVPVGVEVGHDGVDAPVAVAVDHVAPVAGRQQLRIEAGVVGPRLGMGAPSPPAGVRAPPA